MCSEYFIVDITFPIMTSQKSKLFLSSPKNEDKVFFLSSTFQPTLQIFLKESTMGCMFKIMHSNTNQNNHRPVYSSQDFMCQVIKFIFKKKKIYWAKFLVIMVI